MVIVVEVIAPAPAEVTFPSFVNVVTEHVPLIFKVPVELLVKVPAPESAVATVKVPLLVYVPVKATDGILVVVEPLIVSAVPEKVCTPVLAVKVDALLVKLPAIA